MIHDGNKGGGPEHLWKGKRLYCFKCGHQWISRSETRPNVCPKCHIRRYDIPPDMYTCKSCGAEWKPGCVDDICPKCGHAITEGTSVREHSCNQCGHIWTSRNSEPPVRCPNCKTRNWNEPKVPQFLCHKCGYVWKSRIGYPNMCPSCRSKNWDKDTFKLKCFKCGHKWVLNEGMEPDSVTSCPSCRSKKWNQLPNTSECVRCGRLFIVGRKRNVCPECRGSPGCKRCECGFCGAEWISENDKEDVCPICGEILSKEGSSEKLIELWKNEEYRLNYLFKDGIGCIYLWRGKRPEACRYMEKMLDKWNLSFNTAIGRAKSERYRRFWESVIEDMLSHKDDFRENIPYLMRRLRLDPKQSEILALHFTRMSLETISLRLGRPLKEIRHEFTRIQAAYNECGIIVNDSVYTENPMSLYDHDPRIIGT